jgi:hypothetical protein
MYVVGLMQLNEFWMNLLSTVRVDTRGKVPCDGLCQLSVLSAVAPFLSVLFCTVVVLHLQSAIE